MKFGLFPNTTKANIIEIVEKVIKIINNNNGEVIISNSFNDIKISFSEFINLQNFADDKYLLELCDFVISIGGDGTMLNTAYRTINCKVPLIGVNFGKLGFLAEYDLQNLDEAINDIIKGNYIVEERMILEGKCISKNYNTFYAINDFVVEKGMWPKMIEIDLYIDDNFVTSFLADGLIIASPTGSTAYSLSVGGPIVSPIADAITISPISPHSLTMRPLVISATQKIKVIAKSQHTSIQINSDGQRVENISTPVTFEFKKSDKYLRMAKPVFANYFATLRTKLMWGFDVRNNN
ncbi:MAG TPA: NAD(+)/NADH kinase [Melioribacteraceae bacterium]|nr:NAD(+)/NADH kinase [Melioribacteraceae bacterium]